ncbi:hypothetical protein ES703_43298 [subsurface metagenome]
MGFILYCDGDPRKLGIEDEQGNWDLVKFREHIHTCAPCKQFRVVPGCDCLDTMLKYCGRRWRFRTD